MSEILENESPGMKQIMEIIGLGKMEVIKFTLNVAYDRRPTMTATFYPEGKEHLPENIVQQEFILCALEDIRRSFANIPDEERLNIMAGFCKHCGSADPHCQCWNDD